MCGDVLCSDCWVGVMQDGREGQAVQACEEGGEAERGGQRGTGGGAWCARNLGERAAVRALEGDAPLFVAADFLCLEC